MMPSEKVVTASNVEDRQNRLAREAFDKRLGQRSVDQWCHQGHKQSSSAKGGNADAGAAP
jgi:hypothetical protein